MNFKHAFFVLGASPPDPHMEVPAFGRDQKVRRAHAGRDPSARQPGGKIKADNVQLSAVFELTYPPPFKTIFGINKGGG